MKKNKTKALPKTPWRARVRIAQDVIAQVQAKQIVPSACTYGEEPYEEIDEDARVSPVPCHACALGSMFIAKVGMQKAFNYGSYLDRPDIEPELRRYFSMEQLACIENAFERVAVTEDHYRSTQKAVVRHFRRGLSDRERVLRLMHNIVRNRGTFVPTDTRNVSARTVHPDATKWKSEP